MDHYTLIKGIHFIGAFAALSFVIVRAMPLFVDNTWSKDSDTANKIRVACHHTSYTIVVASGLWMWWKYLQFGLKFWLLAKIILFAVLLSASAKAFTRRKEVPVAQRKAGIILAVIAMLIMFALAVFKPMG